MDVRGAWPGDHCYLNDDPTPILAAVLDTASGTAKAGVRGHAP